MRYSIDRNTDMDRKFSIDSNGLVTTSKLLDRELVQSHRIHILAIDRGNPPQTGTGTLMVHLSDVNDNPPEFASSYRPVVYENRPPGQTVVVISAVDRDTASNGPPFEMWLPCGGVCPCHSNPTCADFEFRFLREGGENNVGAGLVRTLRTFDRETRKEFRIPIVLKDSGSPPVSGTSTLTVVIGDINDNQHYPGHKDVLVYNYVGWRGEFETLPFGNVYAEDEDDWDVSNKTFHLLGHKYDEDLFGIERHTGHLYSKGRLRGSEYYLRVKVHDLVWKKEVTSTITVRVKEITDDALNNLGSFRMEGITAEEFIRREKIGAKTSEYGQSKMDLFASLLSKKLGPKYQPSDVEIISIINTPSLSNVVDVRFSVHASPYLRPSKLNGILSIYRDEFEEILGGQLLMSPIDECLDEKQCYGNKKGCMTRVVTSDSDPLIVNTNSSSLVGVLVTSYAECSCKGHDFLGEKGLECQPGTCLNGGTCVQASSSVECLCPVGYKGPRCQQTHISFNGDGYAWFPGLDQCDESHTSFEFVTLKENGLLLFYGPMMERRPDSNEDFMLLELRGGYPYMRINLGSGEIKLSLDGNDKQGVKRTSKLNDGKWHRIDVIINTRTVQLVVDRCENGIILQESDSDSSPSEDRKSCESLADTPGEGRRLNVNSLLSLGGRHQDHRTNFPPNVMKDGFDGCIKNFMHNAELFDLHVGKTGGGLNMEDFCTREDKICYNKRYEAGNRREKEQMNATLLKTASCGEEGTCVVGLVSPSETYLTQMCLCNPGWRGTFCNKETTILDFGTKSFLEWDFKDDFYSYMDKNGGHRSDLKLMFRTRRTSGLLFKAQNAQKSEYILLEIHQSRLRFRFNLGHRENSLVLSRVNVTDGIWHSVSVERRGRWVEMRTDKGEGLHYNSTLGFPDEGRVEIKLSQRSILSGGDVRFPSSESPPLVDHDFEDDNYKFHTKFRSTT